LGRDYWPIVDGFRRGKRSGRYEEVAYIDGR